VLISYFVTVLEVKNNDGRCRKTAVRINADQLQGTRSHISNLPYEIIETIAYCIKSGDDLVNWATACKGSANLDDLSLLTRLPGITKNGNFRLGGFMEINKPLTRE
jgi:hypothetical protein